MAYTEIDNPTDYFNTVLYTGNSGTQAIAVGFQSDWVWCKPRGNTGSHFVTDSVRGGTKVIFSNTPAAEITRSNNITGFTSTGYTLGADGTSNYNGDATVSWNWKAGTSFTNDASSTSVGSIDSAGSVNTDAGFSIISYTGTGSNGTIAHGLGAKPDMILIKNRSNGQQWSSYWSPLGATKYMRFATTNAVATASNRFANTEPTTSVFTVSTDGEVNQDGLDLIAYCFTNIQGYSKVGSYTGNNNADGPFVYTGFKPAWLMIKIASGTTNNWMLYDNKRSAFNLTDDILEANNSGAEGEGLGIDMLSNGFKIRTTAGNGTNYSGGTYIYMAFAEQPFTTSTGVPATAR